MTLDNSALYVKFEALDVDTISWLNIYARLTMFSR